MMLRTDSPLIVRRNRIAKCHPAVTSHLARGAGATAVTLEECAASTVSNDERRRINYDGSSFPVDNRPPKNNQHFATGEVEWDDFEGCVPCEHGFFAGASGRKVGTATIMELSLHKFGACC